MYYNQIGAEGEGKLQQVILHNQQQVIKQRNQFIQALIMLAADKANLNSQSLWVQLPIELMLYIISFIQFRATDSIGKNVQQINACTRFIFEQMLELKKALKEAIATAQNFKIIEKNHPHRNQFYFFSATQLTTLQTHSMNEEPSSCAPVQGLRMNIFFPELKEVFGKHYAFSPSISSKSRPRFFCVFHFSPKISQS